MSRLVDLAVMLQELAAEPLVETHLMALAESPLTAWRLLRLAPGGRWEPSHGADEEHTVLVLEGIATWHTGETRQSLGPGHLLVASAADELGAVNDSPEPVIALVGRTRRTSAPSAERSWLDTQG